MPPADQVTWPLISVSADLGWHEGGPALAHEEESVFPATRSHQAFGYDPDIIPLLDARFGSAFERDRRARTFVAYREVEK